MKRHLVKPGDRIDLNQLDPGDSGGFEGGKDEGKERLLELNERLAELQQLLFAEARHKVLVVLQGMDTSGKDGTIRNVFRGVNPAGVRVAAFKAPSPFELAHDYLWRIHAQVPGKGELVIFNRSHYEDVGIVRVHKMVSEQVWQQRYDQINNFEKHLAENGTKIVKFFLHIDLDEQKKRLESRIEDSEKNWKFNSGDLAERALWPDYMTAFSEAISKTSTEWAPWHVIPSNPKWYRNLAIASVIIALLEKLDMQFPKAEEGLSKITIS